MKIAYQGSDPLSYSLVRAADGSRYNFASSGWDAASADPPTADQFRSLDPLGSGLFGAIRTAEIPGLADPTLATRTGSYGSFRFTGASYHVVSGPTACLTPAKTFTWACWARRTGSVAANSTLIGEGSSTSDVPLFQLRADDLTGTHMGVAVRDGAGKVASIVGTVAVADTAWHHAAVTCDGTTLALYVDGKPDGTVDMSGLGAQTADRLCLGGLARTSLACPFAGDLEDVRGYGRALSASEVAALAREWLSGPAGDGDIQVVIWTMGATGTPTDVLDVIPLAWLAPCAPMPGGAGA